MRLFNIDINYILSMLKQFLQERWISKKCSKVGSISQQFGQIKKRNNFWASQNIIPLVKVALKCILESCNNRIPYSREQYTWLLFNFEPFCPNVTVHNHQISRFINSLNNLGCAINQNMLLDFTATVLSFHGWRKFWQS